MIYPHRPWEATKTHLCPLIMGAAFELVLFGKELLVSIVIWVEDGVRERGTRLE
jgi:hypothetical protein